MILLKSRNYIKDTGLLSEKERGLLLKQEILLIRNMFNSKLHTKKIKGFGTDKVFSFRITRVYRGIFRLSGQNIILFAIGHRKDIYQSLD